jgi:hypothetical protein
MLVPEAPVLARPEVCVAEIAKGASIDATAGGALVDPAGGVAVLARTALCVARTRRNVAAPGVGVAALETSAIVWVDAAAGKAHVPAQILVWPAEGVFGTVSVR